MLKKIMAVFAGVRRPRTVREELGQQIELAEYLRDMLGVAGELDLDVVVTVQVGNLSQGVLVSGKGPEVEWLYNFACAEILSKGVRLSEMRTDAKFGPGRNGGEVVRGSSGGENSAREGP